MVKEIRKKNERKRRGEKGGRGRLSEKRISDKSTKYKAKTKRKRAMRPRMTYKGE